MDHDTKGALAALRDISALGVMSVSLTAAAALAVLAVVLATTTNEAWPSLMGMWYPALSLFGAAIVVEVLRCAGVVRPGPALTVMQGGLCIAVPIYLSIAVSQHGAFLEAKMAEIACIKNRAADIDQADRRQTGARAALKKCAQEFEQNKTIFTETTVDVACKSPQRVVDVAAQALKSATDRICVPAATGALH
jgi:hypothetical protein